MSWSYNDHRAHEMAHEIELLKAEVERLREALKRVVATEFSLTSHLAALEQAQAIARRALEGSSDE